jgi:hypothetical protein
MNKIGIFGDSFGQNSRFHIPKDSSNLLEYSSWIELIGTTRSHAIGGTDVQWSFLEFEKHHSKYDQVIFVLTNPFRFTLKDNNVISDVNNLNVDLDSTNKLLKLVVGRDAVTRMKDADNVLKNNNIETYHIWNALMELEKLTPTLLINEDYTNRIYLFYNLVIERIKQIRSDIKFIPACCCDCSELSIPSNISCLKDIMNYENKIMKWKNAYDGRDTRIAHLTEESHTILAKLIKQWLKTDDMFFDFDIKEFHNIKPNLKDYYTNE